MALIIGITGGIGSGKTAATDYFAAQGIEIVDADVVARTAVEPQSNALNLIAQRYGDTILNSNGSLNRRQLRNIIFDDTNERQWLETLLHPLINQAIVTQLQTAQSPYAILVSPLLLESTQHQLVDRMLVIDVHPDTQITRATARDNMTTAKAQQIIATQISRAERQQKADDLVNNEGSLAQLHSQLAQLHQRYLTLTMQV